MATYPIKVLLDRNRQPFIPFATTSSIVENGTNRRLDKILGNLDDLQTNNKNSLVSAINEILTQHGSGGSSTGWQVVDVLPTENISATTIYLLPKEGSTKPNIYEEWIWVNEDWESIGTTEIDLSGYATTNMIGDLNTLKTTDKDCIVDAVNELVDKQLVAGDGITLDGNTINLSGSTIKTLTEDPVMLANLDPGLYLCKSPKQINHWGTIYNTGVTSNNTSTVFPILVYKNSYNRGCAIMWSNQNDIVCFGQNQKWASYSYSSFASLSNLTNYISKTNTTSYTPTNDYHPATKKYVDDTVAAAGGGSGSAFDPAKYLAIDNTTEYTPTDLYHPATKAYVDSQIASVPEPVDAYSKTEIDGKLSNYLSKTNTESYTPTSDYHPATKKFVESVVSSIDMSGYYNKTDIATLFAGYNTRLIYDDYQGNTVFTDPDNLTKTWDFLINRTKIYNVYGNAKKDSTTNKLCIFEPNPLTTKNAYDIEVNFGYTSNTGVLFDGRSNYPEFYYVDDTGVEQRLDSVELSDSAIIEPHSTNSSNDKIRTYHYVVEVYGNAVGKDIYIKRYYDITAKAATSGDYRATFAYPYISAKVLE